MKKLIVIIILFIFTSSSLCRADHDDIVAENIDKVKACLKNNDLSKAKEILAGDFNKYVKAYYSGKLFNGDEMIGFHNLEHICLYSGLISFLEEDYEKANMYIEAAIGIICIVWGKSWYDNFNFFIEENEQIFSKKSNLMKAKLYHMVSIVYKEVGEKKNEIKYLEKARGLNPNLPKLSFWE